MYYKNKKALWDIEFEKQLMQENQRQIELQKKREADKKRMMAYIDQSNQNYH
jgi:hypothetical protein